MRVGRRGAGVAVTVAKREESDAMLAAWTRGRVRAGTFMAVERGRVSRAQRQDVWRRAGGCDARRASERGGAVVCYPTVSGWKGVRVGRGGWESLV